VTVPFHSSAAYSAHCRYRSDFGTGTRDARMATRLCWRAATGHTVTATNLATSSIDRATAVGISDTAVADLPTSPPRSAHLLLVHRVPAANRPAPSLAQSAGVWPSPARVSRLVTLRQPPSPGCSTVPAPPLRSIERPRHQWDQYPVEFPRVEHGTKPSAHAAMRYVGIIESPAGRGLL
jgi:hypothetical protein